MKRFATTKKASFCHLTLESVELLVPTVSEGVVWPLCGLERLIFHFSILTTKMHLIISKLKFLKNVVLSWEVCWKKINLTNCFIKKFVGQSIFIKRKKVQFTFRTKFLDILSTRFQLKEKKDKVSTFLVFGYIFSVLF